MKPTVKPRLNADARAVLLQAHLNAADVPRPVLGLRGDLRRAQFDRGRDRLRAAGLLVGETDFLTEEGASAALELQENDRRLHSGIRYEDREPAIRLRGGRDTAKVLDEWQTVTLDGQPAFTNGYVLMLGYPPSENRLAKTFQPRLVEAAWKAAGEAAPKIVRPVAYFEQQGYKERTRHVVLSSGVCVDADALNFILQRAPGAVLTHDASTDKRSSGYSLNFYLEGRRVAMLAPYTIKEGREGVAAVLEPERDREPDQLRTVKDDADRAARVGRFLSGRLQGKADSIAADYRFFLHADKLAALAGLSKLGDIYGALRANPAHCLTWLLLCWQGADEELMTCTGRTRAGWLEMIMEPGRQKEEAEPEPEPAREPRRLPPFDSRRATQQALDFDALAA